MEFSKSDKPNSLGFGIICANYYLGYVSVQINLRKNVNLDMFDHFSKKFRIAAIRRENLEFLKSGKPNFLGLAKFAQINF